jgi:hypothetical protein
MESARRNSADKFRYYCFSTDLHLVLFHISGLWKYHLFKFFHLKCHRLRLKNNKEEKKTQRKCIVDESTIVWYMCKRKQEMQNIRWTSFNRVMFFFTFRDTICCTPTGIIIDRDVFRKLILYRMIINKITFNAILNLYLLYLPKNIRKPF